MQIHSVPFDNAEYTMLPNIGIGIFKLSEDTINHVTSIVDKYKPDGLNVDPNGGVKDHNQQWLLYDDDHWFQNNVLTPAVQGYLDNFGIPMNNRSTHQHCFTFQRWWANESSAGEYQALHNHDSVFSFVIWLEIPFDADKEQSVKGTFHPEAGDYVLTYTDIIGRIRKVNKKLDKNCEGQMFIFPSDLYHVVYPHFLTKNRRRSVAGDIALNSLELSNQGPGYTSALGPTNTQEDCVKGEEKGLKNLRMPDYTGW
tara:strand:+ start:218 stop:982 length:765 start_codon:yes stop_codon:yes gene_type:complete